MEFIFKLNKGQIKGNEEEMMMMNNEGGKEKEVDETVSCNNLVKL